MENIFQELEKIGLNKKDGLFHFMDEESEYLRYITQFPEEGSMARLEKAVDLQDYEEAEKAVHALKGIVTSLEFVPLADACVDMLAELREGNIPDALDAFADIKKEYKRFCDVIRRCRSI